GEWEGPVRASPIIVVGQGASSLTSGSVVGVVASAATAVVLALPCRQGRQGVPELAIDHLDVPRTEMEELLPEPRGDGQDACLDVPHHGAPGPPDGVGVEQPPLLLGELEFPQPTQRRFLPPPGLPERDHRPWFPPRPGSCAALRHQVTSEKRSISRVAAPRPARPDDPHPAGGRWKNLAR